MSAARVHVTSSCWIIRPQVHSAALPEARALYTTHLLFVVAMAGIGKRSRPHPAGRSTPCIELRVHHGSSTSDLPLNVQSPPRQRQLTKGRGRLKWDEVQAGSSKRPPARSGGGCVQRLAVTSRWGKVLGGQRPSDLYFSHRFRTRWQRAKPSLERFQIL